MRSNAELNCFLWKCVTYMAIVNLGGGGGRRGEENIVIIITNYEASILLTSYHSFIGRNLTNVFLPVQVSHSLSLLSVPNDNKCRPSELKHSPFTCPL